MQGNGGMSDGKRSVKELQILSASNKLHLLGGWIKANELHCNSVASAESDAGCFRKQGFSSER